MFRNDKAINPYKSKYVSFKPATFNWADKS